MSLALPGKVVKLLNKKAVVEMFGSRKEVKSKFVDVKPGDYVLVQQGIIVDKLSADEVFDILSDWENYTVDSEQLN